MARIQFLRVVLPAILLLFVGFLVVTLRPRPAALGTAPHGSAVPAGGPLAEGIEITELWAGERRFFLRAGLGRLDEQGHLKLEKVERVEVAREEGPPLVLSADRGSVDGDTGKRVLLLEGGVVLRDEASGIRVELPSIQVSEAEGEARSLAPLQFAGPGYRGQARALVYGLDKGEPVLLDHPEVQDSQGATAVAGQAVARAGATEIELTDQVRVVRGPTTLEGAKIRLLRDDQERLRAAEGSGGVRCVGLPIAQGTAAIGAERLRLDWDDRGEPAHAFASGRVELRGEAQSLLADEIDLARQEAGGILVSAKGSVRADGKGADGLPAELRTDSLTATLDSRGAIRSAQATGNVRFRARGAEGEAASGTFDASRQGGEASLFAGPAAPARLARERTRVAAQTIATDLRGTRLRAEGRVEATLLGTQRSGAGPGRALFEAEKAVHFLSSRLTGESEGKRLVFEGAVRGWQGERNLSAERVDIDETHDTLLATGSVTSRFPLDDASAASQGEFVQVTAESLKYSGSDGRVVYDRNTRTVQSDGWIEGDRIEVDLDESGKKAREIQVVGAVRFEMTPKEVASERGPVRGTADRAIYSPLEKVLRLFGETAPASVTRSGATGGTTTGRVLRYRLDAGTLEVESSGEAVPRGGDGSRGGG